MANLGSSTQSVRARSISACGDSGDEHEDLDTLAALQLHSPRMRSNSAPHPVTILKRSATDTLLLETLNGAGATRRGSGGIAGRRSRTSSTPAAVTNAGQGEAGNVAVARPPARVSRSVSFSDAAGAPLTRTGPTHSIDEYTRGRDPPPRPVELDLPPLGMLHLRTSPAALLALEALRLDSCCGGCLRRWRRVFFIFDGPELRLFTHLSQFLPPEGSSGDGAGGAGGADPQAERQRQQQQQQQQQRDNALMAIRLDTPSMYVGRVNPEHDRRLGRLHTITLTFRDGQGGGGGSRHSGRRVDVKLALTEHERALELSAALYRAGAGELAPLCLIKLREAQFISEVCAKGDGDARLDLQNMVQRVQLREQAAVQAQANNTLEVRAAAPVAHGTA
eukprot:g5979.t1